MIAIAVLLLWISYGLGLWGVSLLKGWNLGFKQLWSPTGYYTGKWPPATAGNEVIIPDGTAGSLASSSFAGTTTSPGGGGAPPPPGGVSGQGAISAAAKKYGWQSGQQWNALLKIIARESGGNPNISNPGPCLPSQSHAYGIAQACGHAGPGEASCGHDAYGGYGLSSSQARAANCGDAWYQLVWMMNYIKAEYGTPVQAWNQEMSGGGY